MSNDHFCMGSITEAGETLTELTKTLEKIPDKLKKILGDYYTCQNPKLICPNTNQLRYRNELCFLTIFHIKNILLVDPTTKEALLGKRLNYTIDDRVIHYNLFVRRKRKSRIIVTP